MAETLKLNKNPLVQFQNWFADAVATGMKYPDAMTLATASKQGVPSARIVLFKGMYEKGNQEGFKFYTNYKSRKGKELLDNPRAALLFYWPALNRQIRIEGRIQVLPPSESDAYWETRPHESRINSAASPQSQKILNREVLIQKVKTLDRKYPPKNASGTSDVPRPKHWGGYLLIPQRFEFWIEGEFRLHDRFEFVLKKGAWYQSRLAP